MCDSQQIETACCSPGNSSHNTKYQPPPPRFSVCSAAVSKDFGVLPDDASCHTRYVMRGKSWCCSSVAVPVPVIGYQSKCRRCLPYVSMSATLQLSAPHNHIPLSQFINRKCPFSHITHHSMLLVLQT